MYTQKQVDETSYAAAYERGDAEETAAAFKTISEAEPDAEDADASAE